MKLMPSLKQKKRYVVFEVVSKSKFSLADVHGEVQAALKDFLGTYGLSKASPMFLKERYAFPHFYIKVNHKYVDHIKAALTLIKTIKKSPVLLKSVTVSGTLKKASSKAK